MFDEDHLVLVRDMGIDHISLGVQSFNDNVLTALGRAHHSMDVYQSMEIIERAFGIDDANYSINLMSSMPGLTLTGWVDTLLEAVSLCPRPTHQSLYDLQVEEGMAFRRWYGIGEDCDDIVTLTTIL